MKPLTSSTVFIHRRLLTATSHSSQPPSRRSPSCSTEPIPSSIQLPGCHPFRRRHSAAALITPEESRQDAASRQAEAAGLRRSARTPCMRKPTSLAAEYMGAGSSDAGQAEAARRVKVAAQNTAIVIYCGCCPWSHCPNVHPAYQMLHSLGFTNVKALYIADNFGTDWVDKGYPVAKGE